MTERSPHAALPGPLRWAVGLLAAEAAAVVLVVAYLVYADLTADAASRRSALLVTGYAALVAAALGGLAWALSRRRAWARSPAIVLQLLLLPAAYYMVSGGLFWLGLPLGATALLVIGLLLTAATREAIGIH
ncbi:MAG TPA: hypothetical protein VFM55_15120 [Micromonosporaceae bacterium]|nr:hypothetical protein [Micromonosporaceae bacterium]